MPADRSEPHVAAGRLAAATGVDRHDALVVLGSGWSGAADAFGQPTAEINTADLPGFHAPAAPGHPGLIRSYERSGRRVLVILGRTHLFEGHGPAAVAHPVRTAAAAGCRTAIFTNASGSLRSDWPPGTGVLISDHLNLTGVSPLSGAHFVDLTNVWSPTLRGLARTVNPRLPEGSYAMLPGPHYNTRAEAIMMRTLGADLVGMSTVLEAIAARAEGMAVLGLSTVTTQEIDGPPIDPDAVVAAAAAAATGLAGTLVEILDRLEQPDR